MFKGIHHTYEYVYVYIVIHIEQREFSSIRDVGVVAIDHLHGVWVPLLPHDEEPVPLDPIAVRLLDAAGVVVPADSLQVFAFLTA